MASQKGSGAAALFAAVAGLLGGSAVTAAVLLALGPPPELAPGSNAPQRPPAVVPPGADGPELARLREEVARLEAENRELRARLARRDADAVPRPDRDPPEGDSDPQAAGPEPPPDEPGPVATVVPLSPAEIGQRIRALLGTGDTPIETGPDGEPLDEKTRRALLAELLQTQLGENPDVTFPVLLEALQVDPHPMLVQAVDRIPDQLLSELGPARLAQLGDALLRLALENRDLETSMLALSALRDVVEQGGGSTAAYTQTLVGIVASSAPASLRTTAIRSLRSIADDDPAFRQTLRQVVRGDPDPGVRIDALRTLSRLHEPGVDGIVQDILANDVDPRVLAAAASVDNLSDPSHARLKSFKAGVRTLIHRDVPDQPRAVAGASLSLLAILDGDPDAQADLEHLAATTMDPSLAEIARRAAAQLADGTASFESMEELWRPWIRGH